MKIYIIIIAALIAVPFALMAEKGSKGAPPVEKTVKTETVEKKNLSDASSQPVASREKKPGEGASFNEEKTTLYQLFKDGGPFMWPILLFFGIALGFIIERAIFFVRSRLGSAEFIDDLEAVIAEKDFAAVEKFCSERDEAAARIVSRGLRVRQAGIDRMEKAFSVAASVQVASLERGLNVISAMGNIVPMLGFLGTVSGMIGAFSKIAAADQVNARLVAGGIQEALLTTAAGLIAAIPALFCYNYFVHRIDIFVAGIERITADIVEKMIEEEK